MDAPPLDYQSRPKTRPQAPGWERITRRIQIACTCASFAAVPLSDLASRWIARSPTRFVGDTITAYNAVAAWGQLMAIAGLAVGFFLLFTSHRKERYHLLSYIALGLCVVGFFLNHGYGAVA
jgi:hypothetical protein